MKHVSSRILFFFLLFFLNLESSYPFSLGAESYIDSKNRVNKEVLIELCQRGRVEEPRYNTPGSGGLRGAGNNQGNQEADSSRGEAEQSNSQVPSALKNITPYIEDSFGGADRTMLGTAVEAVACANELLLDGRAAAAAHLRHHVTEKSDQE